MNKNLTVITLEPLLIRTICGFFYGLDHLMREKLLCIFMILLPLENIEFLLKLKLQFNVGHG